MSESVEQGTYWLKEDKKILLLAWRAQREFDN